MQYASLDYERRPTVNRPRKHIVSLLSLQAPERIAYQLAHQFFVASINNHMYRFRADQLIADIQKLRDEAGNVGLCYVRYDVIPQPIDQGPRLLDSANGDFRFRAQQDVLEILRYRDGLYECHHFPVTHRAGRQRKLKIDAKQIRMANPSMASPL